MGDLHLLDALDEVFDDLMKLGVLLALFGDLVVGVQDGRMVTAAEEVADLRQRGVGELAAEVHGNLARERDAARAFLGMEVLDADLEVGGDNLLDDLERDLFLMAVREDVLEGLGDDVGRDGLVDEEA